MSGRTVDVWIEGRGLMFDFKPSFEAGVDETRTGSYSFAF
jgi:hypothetical protein